MRRRGRDGVGVARGVNWGNVVGLGFLEKLELRRMVWGLGSMCT